MSNKIIPLKVNSNFFFERAVRCLDKMNYKGAIKYFKRAIEHDPYNALNHCNLAGVMSEIGDYRESNKILFHVINYIDRKAYECYFYIANNYANMGDFDRAATYANKYLEVDINGEFASDAEDLLEFFGDVDDDEEYDKETINDDVAQRLLEEGKFEEALKELAKILAEYPDYHVARNNLALTYFYLGKTEAAIKESKKVLEVDLDNIHARCNLAIFYYEQQLEELMNVELNYLRAVTPLFDDHIYKLALTLGMLGEHEQAYRHFRRIIRRETANDYQVYFMLAIAAANTNRHKIALNYLNKAQKLDPGSDIPKFYYELIKNAIKLNTTVSKLGYFYNLPFEEHLKRVELRLEKKVTTEILQDPIVKMSLSWALKHSNETTKLNVIRLLSIVFDDEVKREFDAFLQSPEESDELKKVILILFHQYDIKGPYEVVLKRKKTEVTEEQVSKMYITWKPEWIQVLELVIGTLDDDSGDNTTLVADLESIWIEFLSKKGTDMPKRFHANSWAAALEYAVFMLHGYRKTQAQIANKYSISTATLSSKYKELLKICKRLQRR
ncbi:tetratricopeptide repeat protein [Desulfuribacillus alkaliarsenatis]|uniref:Uncharacterized protein n=1 Tax=Desulfuribacillus alkaliarsenatis TaxID=766136 RepID=A0A1E5G4A6_9FIRM|nr:tetratricopeptide repeat protein [Desulfuribacillus alkaliarsenatis]OEF97844.1 hypothetical protein BHF68_13525 [Desulfuribacillus alkaliarsenatis]